MSWIVLLVLLGCAAWFLLLRGKDHGQYDSPAGKYFAADRVFNEEHRAINAAINDGLGQIKGLSQKERLMMMREHLDTVFADRPLASSLTPVDVDGVPGEWVRAPNADAGRRLLYLHGGAFFMGSRKSHRVITSKLSEIANMSVLAIDYRLMPEHRRMDSVEDSRTAYRWILANGPDGVAPASSVFVAGDSAGGNLTLSLLAWLRDQGLRAPNAAVALSPITDSTLASPSLRDNLEHDVMLRPLFEPLMKIPRFILLLGSLIHTRIRPTNPVISPLLGDLSGLPPLLVHASAHEVLLDDARRYVNKAREAGSPATLHVWSHVPHVWHIYYDELTEGREALEEIGKFLNSHAA